MLDSQELGPMTTARLFPASPDVTDRSGVPHPVSDAHVAYEPEPERPALPSDIAIGDWDLLFRAVTERLLLTVGDRLTARSGELPPDTAERVRSSVLECAQALEQLHTTLANELSRCQRVEHHLADTHVTLAHSRVELAGTQAGERRARHLASCDALTALPNRIFFCEQLDRVLSGSPEKPVSVAVMYLDLDGFKPINDEHGHDAGDELLKIVSARMARAVRSGDMVSRLGGDEFACLLVDVPSREQLIHLACKLFDAIGAPSKVGEVTLTIYPSIGIAMCPGDGSTSETLLRNADAAMYCAKREHIGYAFFDRLQPSRLSLDATSSAAI